MGWHIIVQLVNQVDTCFSGLGRKYIQYILYASSQIEIILLQLHFAGFYL